MSAARTVTADEAGAIAPASRFLIVVAVMAATVMQVLDTTIVNVALPKMQGQLNATSDQISWVLTSYLVASAIFMPLTGFFTDRLGRKNYLLLSIALFVITSMLCGQATTLTELVIFRLLQGVGGAALVPLSQAIMTDIYPPHERGRAMAIWGMGVMVGPILGPTLGGWLTENWSWRWTFYINLPVGLLSLFLAWNFVPDTAKKERRMDWLGLVLFSAAIGCMQFVLDRGNQEDWFASNFITMLTCISAGGFVLFFWHAATTRHKPLFDLRMFKDLNFDSAILVIGLLGLGLYGAMLLQPMMLESLMGYPTVDTGMLMAPRGIASMLCMLVVGRMVAFVDTRYLVGVGVVLAALGTWATTWYSLEVSTWWLIWPLFLQGFGLGMIYVPMSALALATLPRSLQAEGAGLFSLMRVVGSGIGISIVSTMFARDAQEHWNVLARHVSPYDPNVNAYLHSLGMSVGDPMAAKVLAMEVSRQAHMLAMLDAFAFISIALLMMLPLMFLVRDVSHMRAPKE